ncbi:hypothetical protein O9G_001720 [Rozella allomycis CSF55]|uniref:RRM domain-containing protein n=1 Tax=Rozella allomycis (strain CSF55) TaxID=988480 RepID=A0A075ASR9_ROZAC|nr:hypothetical protein O9G_001720 [Rozella allomycis CSF55]|eukprot:EPZ33308.1 hypothetical protein O9G_001720 [Rozella allomycis CSF55]
MDKNLKDMAPYTTENEDSMAHPDACLFIANLPQKLSNEELSERLNELFQGFGVLSIKASRDKRGRPFGFLQFQSFDQDVEDAYQASIYGSGMEMENRRLRVEKARCVRTLLVLNSSMSAESFKNYARSFGKIEFCQSIWTLPHHVSGIQEPVQITCVQYRNRNEAIIAFRTFKTNNQDWEIQWVPNHFVKDPSSWIKQDLFRKIDIQRRGRSKNYLATKRIDTEIFFEENLEDAYKTLPNQVFIGRLNPDLVNEQNIRDKFGLYGEIEQIEIINRKKQFGMPLDAFSFVTYKNNEAAQNAVENEVISFVFELRMEKYGWDRQSNVLLQD